jgi:vacuolar-type H+-ATPase subunit I/STV1
MGLAKAIILAFFNTGALVLFIASCGTNWLESTVGTTKNEYSYYRICSKVGSADATCKDLDKASINCDKRFQMVEAGRAFTLISTIFVGILTVLSFYRIFNNAILVKAFIVGKVYIIVGLLALIFGVFNWIVGFALYSEEYCGYKPASNTDQNKIGPTAPAAFVASCIWLLSLLAECIFSDVDADAVEGSTEDKKEDAAEPTAEAKKDSPKAEETKEATPKAEEKKEETPKAE